MKFQDIHLSFLPALHAPNDRRNQPTLCHSAIKEKNAKTQIPVDFVHLTKPLKLGT